MFCALGECYTHSSGLIGKERANSQDEAGSGTVWEGVQWKTGGDISGQSHGMNDIREATVTVADIHPGLTPTQEKHPLPAQTSTVTPLREDESGDRGIKVVTITAVGTTMQGVSTLRGGQENEK